MARFNRETVLSKSCHFRIILKKLGRGSELRYVLYINVNSSYKHQAKIMVFTGHIIGGGKDRFRQTEVRVTSQSNKSYRGLGFRSSLCQHVNGYIIKDRPPSLEKIAWVGHIEY